MNNYGNLIKSNVISFNDALISNFKQLELDETDVLILIFLNNQLKDNNPLFDVNYLLKQLTIDSKELSKRIMKYLQFEYLELLTNDKNEQIFNNDGLLNELGELLEGKDKKLMSDSELIKKVINYIEVTYQKELRPNDLEYISNWVEEKHSYEDIKEAVLVSVRMNKMTVSYVDRILVTNSHSNENVVVDEKTKQILKGINVRK